MKYFVTTIMLIFITLGYAQENGSIVGKLTDKEMNDEPLPFANVQIKGTSKGTTSDMDGLFEIADVEPGTYTVVISFIGYSTLEVPNVKVVAGKVANVNASLSADSQQLGEVVVTTTARKESEVALLLEQKKAVEIKTNIGAQELSRKGVSDVATAVTKATGISKQEGTGNIFVRGLGDRYNITTMNGLPLPSNNPERKNMDLNIFSTDIVEYISIDKTYNVFNYGDFAGANVDIISKNHTGDPSGSVQIGGGVNSNAIGQETFYLQDGPGFTGFYNKDYPNNPLQSYNFDTSWDRQSVGTPINSEIGLNGGKSYKLGDESRLNIFASANFSSGYSYKEGISRGSVSTQGIARKDFTFDSYSYGTNTTGMANASYLINRNHKLKYNLLYINSSNQSLEEYFGTIDIFDNAADGNGYVRRSTFDRTSLIINQILGEHILSEKMNFDWGVSYNMMHNIIPDRMQNTLNMDRGYLGVSDLSTSDNHRFYQDLSEDEVAANLALSYKFSKDQDDNYKGKFILGYSGRFKNIDFEATQINFRITKNNVTQPEADMYNMDAYFNQANLNAGYFNIETFRGSYEIPNALDPQTYDGSQMIQAGFGALEYKFNPKFTAIAGLRSEYIYQEINWDTSLDKDNDEFDKLEILPSLALKYEVNDKHNLKFAASKTYTLPQFKERAPFQYQEVTQTKFGNPDLYPSTDYNADIKWEFYPKSSELIAVTAFGKYIMDPINEVTVASATNDISWVNSGEKATAIGAEFELRKDLYAVKSEDGSNDTSLSFGFNASYMYTNQDLDSNKVNRENVITPLNVSFTDTESGIAGASDLILNADATYFTKFSENSNIQTTLAYNYFSDRIYALSSVGKGNLIDKGYGTLDFIVKSELSKKIGLDISVKNILNPTIERFQEYQDVIVQRYKRGINFKLSVSYKF